MDYESKSKATLFEPNEALLQITSLFEPNETVK